MHFPSMISLISQRLHETERASFFSLLTSGSALGTLLTGSLGSYLLENYNWIIVFFLLYFYDIGVRNEIIKINYVII